MESCKEAAIRGNYVSAVNCLGRFGCQSSEIIINNPAPGFSLECGGKFIFIPYPFKFVCNFIFERSKVLIILDFCGCFV